jgi:hypothetical protein
MGHRSGADTLRGLAAALAPSRQGRARAGGGGAPYSSSRVERSPVSSPHSSARR